MPKPETLKDLVAGGHTTLSEVRAIARAIFNSEITMAGPEGYLVTGVNLDDLSDNCQQFIVKAVLEFSVENILDVETPDQAEAETPDPAEDEEADAESDLPGPAIVRKGGPKSRLGRMRK